MTIIQKINKSDRIYKTVCIKKYGLYITIILLSHELENQIAYFLLIRHKKNKLNFLLDIEAEMGYAKKKYHIFIQLFI